MAALTTVVAAAGLAGTDPTAGMTVATAADTFPADGEVWLRVTNTGAAPVNVTVTPPAGSGPRGTTIAPQVFGPVPITTGDRVFGPFPANPYADSSGNVNIAAAPVAGTTKVCPIKFSG
jgi:hypothetical protein